MNKPHKHCELIKAWADGREIQVKYLDDSWVDDLYPCFFPNNEYRIKPRTVKRGGWVNLCQFDRGSVHANAKVYRNFEAAIIHKNDIGYVTTVRVEWEEEE